MTFEGYTLNTILRRQKGTVEVKDGRGFTRGTITPDTALNLTAKGSFVGVGTIEQIRYLRPIGAPTLTLRAEDSITTVGGSLHGSSRRQHHMGRCDAYGPQHRG